MTSTRLIRPRKLVCLLAGLALLLAAPIALAAVGQYTCTDPSKIFYGNSRLFQRPAAVDSSLVYDRISEYQEIVRRGLTAKHPQYHLLVEKTGAIRKTKKTAKDVPDRTQDVIQKLD